MKEKRAWKYGLMINLILALIVMSIILFYIFQEIGGDELDQETCRQSIFARAHSRDIKAAGVTWVSLKEKFPLKCKTDVIEVSKEDVLKNRTGKIIGDALVACWSLYGNGDLSIMPAPSTGFQSVCSPCARIHLNSEARKLLENNPVDIWKALKTEKFRGVPYFNYLYNIGKDYAPFFGALMRGKEFEIVEPGLGANIVAAFSWKMGKGQLYLPEYYDGSLGDMVIAYGGMTSSNFETLPYMFYFPSDQKNVQKELKKYLVGGSVQGSGFCEYWDGVPA